MSETVEIDQAKYNEWAKTIPGLVGHSFNNTNFNRLDCPGIKRIYIKNCQIDKISCPDVEELSIEESDVNKIIIR